MCRFEIASISFKKDVIMKHVLSISCKNMVQLSKDQRVFIVKTYYETKKFSVVQRLFRERFPERNPPSKSSIWDNVQKYQTHGTSLNRNAKNSGRKRTGRSDLGTIIAIIVLYDINISIKIILLIKIILQILQNVMPYSCNGYDAYLAYLGVPITNAYLPKFGEICKTGVNCG